MCLAGKAKSVRLLRKYCLNMTRNVVNAGTEESRSGARAGMEPKADPFLGFWA